MRLRLGRYLVDVERSACRLGSTPYDSAVACYDVAATTRRYVVVEHRNASSGHDGGRLVPCAWVPA